MHDFLSDVPLLVDCAIYLHDLEGEPGGLEGVVQNFHLLVEFCIAEESQQLSL